GINQIAALISLPARESWAYGSKKDDAPAPLAPTAIAAVAAGRKHSDRRNQSRNEKRRAQIRHYSSASAFGRCEVIL
ncbi:MAG: hypothetical protein ABR514_01885, partial [Chthoniobacterales bacterium]